MSDLADKIAIRELLERYCDGVNQRSAEIWASTWADDALWEMVHLDVRVESKANIVETWSGAMELFPFVNMLAQPGFIKIDGDKATMRSYTNEVAVKQDGTELRPLGEYEDEMVRVNGQWLFSSRKFRVLHGE